MKMSFLMMVLSEQTDIAMAEKRIDDMCDDFAGILETALASHSILGYEVYHRGNLQFCIVPKDSNELVECIYLHHKDVRELQFQIFAPKEVQAKIANICLELLKQERELA